MNGREEERLARVALGRLGEPGDPRIATLLEGNSAVAVYDAFRSELGPDGLRSDVAGRLVTIDPARDLDVADRLGIRFVIPGDAEWPVQLDDLRAASPVQERSGAPMGLWVRGPLRLDELETSVSIVGSRSATTYGAHVAGELAAVGARAGLVVVSGAAFGIDQAAHRGAVAAGGRSVAVLACGVDRPYPAAHHDLIEHLARTGAVVSELAPGCSPTRLRFLARNRMIAALTGGTVVVEAALRSGALNTANWATRLNRHLLGVPGPVTSAPSQGVHQLIRTGAATLVTSGEEVLEVLGRTGQHLLEVPRGRERPRDRLSLRQQQVLDAVPVSSSVGADSIARTAGLNLLEVGSALTRLLEHGLVVRAEGGWRLAGLASG